MSRKDDIEDMDDEDMDDDTSDFIFYDHDDIPLATTISKFIDKIVYNILSKRRKGTKVSLSDDLFFSYVKDYDEVLFGTWREIYNKKYNEYKEYKKTENQNENQSRYFLPSDFLKQDDYDEILETIRNESPWVVDQWTLTKNTKVVSELLDIDEYETLILNLALAIPSMSYSHREIFDRIMYNEEMRIASKAYSRFFDIEEQVIQKSLNGFLMSSGFLISSSSIKGLHTIDQNLAEAFNKPDVSKESIEKFLFPENLSTDLSFEDYDHVSKEINITESIIAKALENKTVGMNVMFWGIAGTGKTEAALVLAKKHGWNLKIIGDISQGDNEEKSRAQRVTSLRVAMKLYSKNTNTVLLFDEMEDLFRGQKNETFSKAFVNRIIETTKTPIIWTTNELFPIGSAVLRRMVYNIEFDVPPIGARRKIWRKYNTKYNLNLSDEIIDNLAQTYNMVPALINNAAKITSMSGINSDQIPEVLSSLDTLMNLGQKRHFDDKPKEKEYAPYNSSLSNTDIDLERVAVQVEKARPKWTMCCYGAPGTGKSEYGRYLAKKIGKKLMIKRASDLISMWVGETEKNIAKAFKEAKDEGRVLLIDEGDTFLRSRKLARNSWEVSQTNEMLTQMESHSEPFILTTNLMDDIDEAALRRFTFKIKFDFVKPQQAVELFKSFFGFKPPKEILSNHILAPGDFASVKAKVEILNITDPKEIYEMLEGECALKPQKSRSIGFK